MPEEITVEVTQTLDVIHNHQFNESTKEQKTLTR